MMLLSNVICTVILMHYVIFNVHLLSSLVNLKIWALQDGTSVIIGGKTNRAKAEFPDDMNRLLDRVPELVESSRSKQSDGISG